MSVDIADGSSTDGDALEWCSFDADSKPVADTVKCSIGVSPQGVLSAVAFRDGRFAIVY